MTHTAGRADAVGELEAFGYVARAHGVRGALRVVPLAPDVVFPDTELVVLRERSGREHRFTVVGVRPAHDAYLVELEELTQREAAEAMRGATLLVPRSSLEPPAHDEAYVFELTGARVIDAHGNALGVVKAILRNGPQDLLSIETPDGERLLPMVDETIEAFDRAARTLTVKPVPGLWE